MARTLFEISDDLIALENAIASADLNDREQAALIDQFLSDLGRERARKLDNYAALIAELESRAKARQEEAKRLQELSKIDSNKAKSLKERLKFFFENHNLDKVETPRYRLTLAKNGGKRPLIVDEVDLNNLPLQFIATKKSLDKTAVRDVLESGEPLSFARLGARGTSLRIK